MKKFLYWFVQLTWGALLSIPGLIVFLFCVIFLKCDVHKNGLGYICQIGGNWGGLELGPVALCGHSSVNGFEKTRRHEYGHSIQNMMFGPLMIFIVCIPSACRYWYDRLEKKHASERDASGWYYKVWFERQANELGDKYVR